MYEIPLLLSCRDPIRSPVNTAYNFLPLLLPFSDFYSSLFSWVLYLFAGAIELIRKLSPDLLFLLEFFEIFWCYLALKLRPVGCLG